MTNNNNKMIDNNSPSFSKDRKLNYKVGDDKEMIKHYKEEEKKNNKEIEEEDKDKVKEKEETNEKKIINEEDEKNEKSKTLLISTKRPRAFLERCARELLAGQTEIIILSALGDAIPLCVNLQLALEQKKAVVCTKVETSFNPYYNKGVSGYTPGIRIYVKKHEEFKGSRISPGYVFFCENPKEKSKYTSPYDSDSYPGFASVNAGDVELYVGGEGINGAFGDILRETQKNVTFYQSLHECLLQRAMEENEGIEEEETRFIIMDELSNNYPYVKIALCRPCLSLVKLDSTGRSGAVFITAFRDKFPCDNSSNVAQVYVVSPKGSDFRRKEDFLHAVQKVAGNLMTALCDFNGFIRREGKNRFPRINLCRISLFSGGNNIHPDANKIDVAQAILTGLNEGYRHGPAPRLNFTYDDDVFKKAWMDVMGFEVFQTNLNTSKFYTNSNNSWRGRSRRIRS